MHGDRAKLRRGTRANGLSLEAAAGYNRKMEEQANQSGRQV
jgi:hypothetical protein